MTDEQAKEIVWNFLDLIWNQHDPVAAGALLEEHYIEHNPSVVSGRAGFVKAVEEILEIYPEASMTLHKIIAEDGFVAAHVHWKPTPAGRGVAAVDLCQLRDGIIVEHWDILQEIPEPSVNQNGMF